MPSTGPASLHRGHCLTVCLRDSALSMVVGACQTERSRLCSAESVPTQGARAVLEATKPCLLRWEHNQLLLCSTYCQPVQIVIAAACAPVRDTHAQGASQDPGACARCGRRLLVQSYRVRASSKVNFTQLSHVRRGREANSPLGPAGPAKRPVSESPVHGTGPRLRKIRM